MYSWFIFIIILLAQYARISSRSCESFGMLRVSSLNGCEAAAIAIGLLDNNAYFMYDNPNLPSGCIYATYDWLAWNEPISATVDCGSNGHDCICKWTWLHLRKRWDLIKFHFNCEVVNLIIKGKILYIILCYCFFFSLTSKDAIYYNSCKRISQPFAQNRVEGIKRVKYIIVL